MCRNRAHARIVPQAEALEGRKLMAFDTFIHLGPLAGAAATDLAQGKTTAADGWVEVYSFGFETTKPGPVSGFDVMLKGNPALLKTLEKATASGEEFADVEVVMKKASDGANKGNFLEYNFDDVKPTGIQFSGSSAGDDTPTESVAFNFGKLTIKYDTLGEPARNGTPPASWTLDKPST